MSAPVRDLPVFVGDFEPGSPEWHKARARGIGGSEIAAVIGLSPWESRFSLWHRKMGLAAPVVETDEMYWGKQLEPAIVGEFQLRHSHEFAVEKAGTWSHYQYPFMVANPDALVHEITDDGDVDALPSALLEVKTARTADGWGEPGTDEIPVYYRTQCLWYLDVFGLDVCHIAVLIAGSEYREYRVEYSAEEADFMRERAWEFLDTVRDNVRPNIDEHDATYQVIKEMHPDIEDVEVEVPARIATPYLNAIEVHKLATAEKQRTTAILADHMGSARRAIWDGEQIAIRMAKGGGTPYVKAQPTKTPGQKVTAA